MTLISFEGPSKSGKTTIYNRVVENHPEFIEIVGPRLTAVGLQEWNSYVRWEHAIKKPIFDANPETTFICNRAFSEAIYATNENIRDGMKRLYGAYDDAAIVYVTADGDTLLDRGTHDAWRLLEILERYDELLSMFEHVEINTTNYTIDEAVDAVEAWIE